MSNHTAFDSAPQGEPQTNSDNFFPTMRSYAQDTRLSFAARGIFWYLLSKPIEWKWTIDDRCQEGGMSRDKVIKALAELLHAGYLQAQQEGGA